MYKRTNERLSLATYGLLSVTDNAVPFGSIYTRREKLLSPRYKRLKRCWSDFRLSSSPIPSPITNVLHEVLGISVPFWLPALYSLLGRALQLSFSYGVSHKGNATRMNASEPQQFSPTANLPLHDLRRDGGGGASSEKRCGASL